MFVDKDLKILKPFLKFGDNNFWLVEIEKLFDFKNVIRMVTDMKRLL